MKMPESVRLSLIALALAIVGVLAMTWSPLLSGPDAELARAGVWISLTRVPLALICLWAVLRLMDWITAWPFAEARQTLQSNPYATAIYHGARFVGVCLLLASIYS